MIGDRFIFIASFLRPPLLQLFISLLLAMELDCAPLFSCAFACLALFGAAPLSPIQPLSRDRPDEQTDEQTADDQPPAHPHQQSTAEQRTQTTPLRVSDSPRIRRHHG